MNQKRKSLKNSILNAVKIPYENKISGINLHLHGDREIYVEGCMGFDGFTDKEVIFLGKGMRITVSGENIELYTFENGSVCASGRLNNIDVKRESEDD